MVTSVVVVSDPVREYPAKGLDELSKTGQLCHKVGDRAVIRDVHALEGVRITVL